MIDPKRELFKWGPIDGRPAYVDLFVQAFIDFPGLFDGTWPDIVGYIKDDLVIFIADYPDLRDRGEHLFRKYVLDEKELRKNYRTWIGITKKILAVEKTVNKGISGMSDEKLTRLFCEWNKLNNDFWIYGFLPELSNWGGEQMLKRELLKAHTKNFTEVFEKLSAPEDLSFFQTEELEFLKIKLVKDRKKQEEKLKGHQKKYYWLRNNYSFTKVLDVNYFIEEIGRISVKDAEKKIKEINDHTGQVKKDKKRVIAKYKISRDIVNMASKLAYCVWWQDLRKKYIFIANHIISTFLEEIGKRKNISFKELCYYTTPELAELVQKDKRIDAKERFGGMVEYYHERGKTTCMVGQKANEFIRPYIEVKVEEGIKEIRGIVVSMGRKVTGTVRILKSPRDLEKMEKGEILVAAMTSPDYIIAMRKASAIITDEGNMTCHAAIVSRELKVPCIVGTRIATKALKDGDVVEIDTQTGVIKIVRQ